MRVREEGSVATKNNLQPLNSPYIYYFKRNLNIRIDLKIKLTYSIRYLHPWSIYVYFFLNDY